MTQEAGRKGEEEWPEGSGRAINVLGLRYLSKQVQKPAELSPEEPLASLNTPHLAAQVGSRAIPVSVGLS